MSLLSFKNRSPAGCKIEIGTPYRDDAVSALYPALVEVKVTVSRSKAGEGTLVFETRRDEHGRWDVEDSGLFRDWTAVRLSAVFGSEATEEILRGFVREMKAEHPPQPGESKVTITVQDLSLAADRDHRRQVWGGDTRTTDRQIVAAILARNRLRLHPNSGLGQADIEVNQDATDAALLRQRAEANGYDLLYDRDTVYFGPWQLSPPVQEPILVAAGPDTNCLSVDVGVDGRKPDVVVVEFADGQGGRPREIPVRPDLPPLGLQPVESAGAGIGDHTFVMRGEGGANEGELRRAAQAKANELSMKLTATGELDGTSYGHVLRVGETVPLDGVGPRFSGTWFVDEVVHSFTVEGYRQQFTLLRNAYFDNGSLAGAVSRLAGVLST